MPAKHSTISNILASKFTQHMSNRTNDEKRRILKERLAQIKEKHKRKVEIEIANPEVKVATIEPKASNLSWIKYIGLIGGVAFGLFYVYNNIDNIFASSDKGIEKTQEFVLEYNLSFPEEDEEVKNIGITASFKEEFLAKAMVNDLKVKGYKCDYFFLPEKSNSEEEVYTVFIGPYETEEEINQWTKNLEVDFEIIKL